MAGQQEDNGKALLPRVEDPNEESDTDTDESETSSDDDGPTLYMCRICREIVQAEDKAGHKALHKGEENVGKGRGL